MENPREPGKNNSSKGDTKRKTEASNEEEAEISNKREKVFNNDPLALSMSSYSDDRRAPLTILNNNQHDVDQQTNIPPPQLPPTWPISPRMLRSPSQSQSQPQPQRQPLKLFGYLIERHSAHSPPSLSPQPQPQPQPLQPPPQPQPPKLFGAQLQPHPAHAAVDVPALGSPSPPPPPSLDPNEGRENDNNNNNNDNDDGRIIVVPPFPWATDRPAKIHSMRYLLQNKISVITGEVECVSCQRKFEMSFDLQEKFRELCAFIHSRIATMHDRAPEEWSNPVLPSCEHCQAQNSVRPIIGEAKDHRINWLFLLLGQLLGMCTLEHLRYFCEHNMNHRSGAKNRVLYLTYHHLIKQLKG